MGGCIEGLLTKNTFFTRKKEVFRGGRSFFYCFCKNVYILVLTFLTLFSGRISMATTRKYISKKVSGPVEAVIALYEEGRDLETICQEAEQRSHVPLPESSVKKYLKIYRYLKSIGQYHVPADIELFEGDIDTILAEKSSHKKSRVATSTRTEEDEREDESDDETEESEEDEDVVEQPRPVRRLSHIPMNETPLQIKFFKWMGKKLRPNVVNSYKVGLRKVLDDAQMEFDDFAPLAETVLPDYYAGGAKSDVGDMSSGAARACVRRLAEFMKTQEPKKEVPKKVVAKKSAHKQVEKKPAEIAPTKKSSPKKSKKNEIQEEPEIKESPKKVSQEKKPAREKVLPKLDKKAEQEIFADPSKSFNAMKKAVSVVAKGIGKALFISGNGGIGKTYAVSSVLEAYGHRRPVDYNILKTRCTPINVYKFLYKNQDRICVFDDCDSVLQNVEGRSVLKSALDSDNVREVFWNSDSKDIVDTTDCMDNDEVAECLERWSKKHDDRIGIPNHFFFNGSVIIISNMKKSEIKKLDEALVTRATSIEVLLTNSEILDRLKGLLKSFKISDASGRDISDNAKKKKVFDWISSKEFLNDPRMEGRILNFRLFINTYMALCANDDGSDDWKQAAFQG